MSCGVFALGILEKNGRIFVFRIEYGLKKQFRVRNSLKLSFYACILYK